MQIINKRIGIRLAAIAGLAALVGLAACDKIENSKPVRTSDASSAAVSAQPDENHEEDEVSKDSPTENEALTKHPEAVQRTGSQLRILENGHPIAQFRDLSKRCVDYCPFWRYEGTLDLMDQATHKMAPYPVIYAMFYEDTDAYVIDHDGRAYNLGFVDPLVSPGGTYIASVDTNIDGDGSLTILDWSLKSRKTRFTFNEACALDRWEDASHLIVYCEVDSIDGIKMRVSKTPSGGWRMIEVGKVNAAALEYKSDGEAHALPGTLIGKAIKPEIFEGQPHSFLSDLPVTTSYGYERLISDSGKETGREHDLLAKSPDVAKRQGDDLILLSEGNEIGRFHDRRGLCATTRSCKNSGVGYVFDGAMQMLGPDGKRQRAFTIDITQSPNRDGLVVDARGAVYITGRDPTTSPNGRFVASSPLSDEWRGRLTITDWSLTDKPRISFDADCNHMKWQTEQLMTAVCSLDQNYERAYLVNVSQAKDGGWLLQPITYVDYDYKTDTFNPHGPGTTRVAIKGVGAEPLKPTNNADFTLTPH